MTGYVWDDHGDMYGEIHQLAEVVHFDIPKLEIHTKDHIVCTSIFNNQV
jgi:hypothetical protein